MQDLQAPEKIFRWKVRDDDPNAVEILGVDASVVQTDLTELTIPRKIVGKRVAAIGAGAFYGCSSLTSVKFPRRLTKIGEGAFYKCSSLTPVKFPRRLRKIEKGAFGYCSSLTERRLPKWLTTIGERAFQGCSSLTSIDLPYGLSKIAKSAFDGVAKNCVFDVPEGTYAHRWAVENGYDVEIRRRDSKRKG